MVGSAVAVALGAGAMPTGCCVSAPPHAALATVRSAATPSAPNVKRVQNAHESADRR
ncbi:hypothetical protein BH09MYX1_BH09MYX1_06220 [soil metagenome]